MSRGDDNFLVLLHGRHVERLILSAMASKWVTSSLTWHCLSPFLSGPPHLSASLERRASLRTEMRRIVVTLGDETHHRDRGSVIEDRLAVLLRGGIEGRIDVLHLDQSLVSFLILIDFFKMLLCIAA